MPMIQNTIESISAEIDSLDEHLSKRFIALDPSGYFLIKLDHEAAELVLEHYSNTIDEKGLAHDPETGNILSCRAATDKRKPSAVFRGRSAKELGIKVTEQGQNYLLSRLDHALYLGRELQKAEICIRNGHNFIQD